MHAYWLLVAGCWLLVAGCWLLVVGCWLLVAGCWLLVAGCINPRFIKVSCMRTLGTGRKMKYNRIRAVGAFWPFLKKGILTE